MNAQATFSDIFNPAADMLVKFNESSQHEGLIGNVKYWGDLFSEDDRHKSEIVLEDGSKVEAYSWEFDPLVESVSDRQLESLIYQP